MDAFLSWMSMIVNYCCRKSSKLVAQATPVSAMPVSAAVEKLDRPEWPVQQWPAMVKTAGRPKPEAAAAGLAQLGPAHSAPGGDLRRAVGVGLVRPAAKVHCWFTLLQTSSLQQDRPIVD